MDPGTRERFDRIVDHNPKRKKIAVVAMMRQWAVLLWHIGLEAQRRAGVFGRGAAATAA